MIDFRQELDEMLERQAGDTPEHIATGSLVGDQVPPRPGSLKDFFANASYKGRGRSKGDGDGGRQWDEC
jgi:hypothetical protein